MCRAVTQQGVTPPGGWQNRKQTFFVYAGKYLARNLQSTGSDRPPDASLLLGRLLALGGVQGGHVLGGGDQVQDADGGLEQADEAAEPLQPQEPA